MTIKLKKNESFYIREGWMEKAINTIAEEDKNIFFKNDGVAKLGIGSNMVKALKYWLGAAGIIEGKNNSLSKLGKCLKEYDPYLENDFSWFLIHYMLVRNEKECPVFYTVFNSNLKSFTKDDLDEYLMNQFLLEDPDVSRKSVEADAGVFIRSYVTEEPITNPEDNYACPLSSLKLLKKNKDTYTKLTPQYSDLSYLLVFYALQDIYGEKAFNIESSMEVKNSPVKLFNLDKYLYLKYLDDMQKNGLVSVNKTAGLNAVYFEKKPGDEDQRIEELFQGFFGEAADA